MKHLDLRLMIPLLFLAACNNTAPQAAATTALQLPATFKGDLPCADCEAIRHHLDLWPDGVFHLRREWVGRNLGVDEIGRWSLDGSRGVLVLQGGAQSPRQWEIKGPMRLRQLDMKGAPIASTLPYELVSDGRLSPARMSLSMGGEMTYMADAMRFSECLTGRNYPVAQEGDYLAMERAYLANRKSPGAPLYVTLDGSIDERQKMEGAGTQPTVVVRRFINTWPAQACERARADSSLVNTYWRIASMAGQPARGVDNRREPNLTLRSGDGRHDYTATVGCNQLRGSFDLGGDALTFKAGVATLMACPAPLDAMERQLVEMLSRTRHYRVTGPTLVLSDAQGQPTGLLEAVYF